MKNDIFDCQNENFFEFEINTSKALYFVPPVLLGLLLFQDVFLYTFAWKFALSSVKK